MEEYSTVYEATKNTIISVPLIVCIIIEILLCMYMFVNWKNNDLGGKIGMCGVATILLVIIISTISAYLSTEYIYKAYTNNEFQIVEGEIKNYEEGNNERSSYVDNFTVEGVSFIVSDNPYTGYGYKKRKIDGGILENGLMCKIYYVCYKEENIIMKLLVKKQ